MNPQNGGKQSVGNELILKIFALWARKRGKARPKTKAGMQLLFSEFMTEQTAWKEIQDQRDVLLLGKNAAGHIQIENDNGQQDDDFHRMAAEREAALEAAGGDDLAREVLLQDKRKSDLEKEANFVRWSPPSARKAILGGVATVGSSAQATGNPQQQTVAMWVGEDDSETTPVAVSLGVEQEKLSAAAATKLALKPYAVIKFGTRGNLTAEVDIGQGVQVVVAGSAVTVDVAMDPIVASEVDASLTLTAMLSFGAIERSTVPTRTKYFGDLTAGSSSAVTAIPRFASNIMAIWRNDVTQAIQVTFEDAGGQVIDVYKLAASTYMTTPIAIPPNAQFIVVKNTGAGDQPTCQVVFGLSL